MLPSQKLSYLLHLADQGPALRAALAEEVAELLIDWPSDYPDSMRSVCEALLTKAARDVDTATRARLRARLASYPGMAQRVLPREASQVLVEAARNGENLAAVLAESLSVRENLAQQILDDDSGTALATACKGANIDRATFSALTLLTRPKRDRSHAYAVLDAFDNVLESDATHALRHWRESHAA